MTNLDKIKHKIGDVIIFDNVEGFITFVCKDYITYCIHQYLKTEEERKHARRPYTQINVIIPRWRWCDIIRTTKVFQNHDNRINSNAMDILERVV